MVIYLNMTDNKIIDNKKREINTTALAYLGDSIYEVYVREYILNTFSQNVDEMHKKAIKFVSAEGQHIAIKKMLEEEFLSGEEISLVRRAKNRKIYSKPKNVDTMTYKLATAFEALIGYLYLNGKKERCEEVVNYSINAL